jgi:peptidoglycan-N-acetylglucosamine deacetylase
VTQRKSNKPLLSTKIEINLKQFIFVGVLVISLYGFTTTTQIVFASSNTTSVVRADDSMPAELQRLITLTPPDEETLIIPAQKREMIFHGPRDRKEIALTFDADMTYTMQQELHDGTVPSYYDAQVIATLEQTQTKATLFLSGLWIESYPEVAKQFAENALFELANHSYSHPSFSGDCYGLPSMGIDQEEEIEKTQRLLFGLTKQPNKYFRFPGGCYDQEDLDLLNKKNVAAIQWDAAGVDGFNDSAESIIANTLATVQNGSIIVLHMNGAPNEPKTAEALPVIIKTLKEQGFTFVTISELLDSKSAKAQKPLYSFLQI